MLWLVHIQYERTNGLESHSMLDVLVVLVLRQFQQSSCKSGCSAWLGVESSAYLLSLV
jgi:hypothetical protein